MNNPPTDRVSSSRVIMLGAAIVAVAAVGFYYIPGMIDSKATGSHIVNSVYCAVMTLTTVGFGDICPSNTLSIYGKAFIMIMSFTGLGMFCGPVMDLAAQWSKTVPGGIVALTTVTIAIGVVLFTYIEDMDQVDAAYMSFITGTTIGYGDITPSSDEGKLAVALYAILVINVMGGLLRPAGDFLERLCHKTVPSKKKDT